MRPSNLSDSTESPLRDVEWVREHLFGGQISTAAVYRMARERLIPSVRIGRRRLFDESVLRGFIKAGGGESAT